MEISIPQTCDMIPWAMLVVRREDRIVPRGNRQLPGQSCSSLMGMRHVQRDQQCICGARGVIWKDKSGIDTRSIIAQGGLSTAQHSLSASVVVANDIPMLHVMEAYQVATCHEVSALRHFRLDTVEDDQSMPASLQLPHSPGIT